MKKVKKIFASSEFVATFASAFEKNRLSGLIGIPETIESVRKPVAKPNPIERLKTTIFSKNAKFLKKSLQD
ncbi:hypothetical protein [uncultured Alistipes sp.]|uniref:hypothetical protein n=1 Tax=uncultured Alistipes sp. TaxID=538949 RepID=UPI00265FA5D7|nr:hypothetical protein [uncultured Alistipes sp.]MCX4302328.1 hypothetical protein [Alistipes sp.]